MKSPSPKGGKRAPSNEHFGLCDISALLDSKATERGGRRHGREGCGGQGQNSGREQSARLKSARLSPLDESLKAESFGAKTRSFLQNADISTHFFRSHAPLIRGWMFTPLIRGVECPKPLVLQCFLPRPFKIRECKCTPLIKGVWVVRVCASSWF